MVRDIQADEKCVSIEANLMLSFALSFALSFVSWSSCLLWMKSRLYAGL